MKKYLPIVLVVVIVGIIIAVAAGKNKDNNNSATPSPSPTSTQSTTNNNTTTPPSSSESSSTSAVTIHDLGFSPANITVKKGTTVTWTNNDSVSHTVTSDSGSTLNSKNLGNGETFSFTFNAVGTFAYHCTIHPSMHGKVTVTD
jgi:plastocyanin